MTHPAGFGFASVHDAAHRSGNRVLSYCFMSNHIHLLLEIVPAAPEGITDAELLRRLRAINSEAQVAEVAREWQKGARGIG